jgi:hypothetical protein
MISPGLQPGGQGDHDIQANPKGVELPLVKQNSSLVI